MSAGVHGCGLLGSSCTHSIIHASRGAMPSFSAFARAAARIKPAQARDGLRLCARIDQLFKSTGMAAAAWEELLTWALNASGAASAAPATATSRGTIATARS